MTWTLRRLALALALAWGAMVVAADPGAVNLLPNPGFENASPADPGAPAGWGTKSNAKTPGGAARLDAEEKHAGRFSVRLRHVGAKNMTKFRCAVLVRPNADYVARFWIKVDPADPPRRADGRPGYLHLLLVAGKKIVASSPRIRETGGAWRQVEVRLNTGPSKVILAQFDWRNNKGTLWIDDAELTGPPAGKAAPAPPPKARTPRPPAAPQAASAAPKRSETPPLFFTPTARPKRVAT